MTDTPEGPLFRASKRRKVFRKRPDEDDEDNNKNNNEDGATQSTTVAMSAPDADTPDAEPQESFTVFGSKQRRAFGTRKGGVAFSSSEARRRATGGDSSALDTNAPGTPSDAIENAQARFVAPTGHVASADDKHIMAYVDSKLARLNSATPVHDSNTLQTSSSTNDVARRAQDTQLQSASHGHLQEVDLTSIASQKRHAAANSSKLQSTKRPRKNRNRRNSADLARDAMVEQILRESQLNHYSANTPSTAAATQSAAGQNEDADERMAQEFERNFYAQAEERAARRTAPPAPAPTFGAKGEIVKGPKLGGSRSQRAAMHAAEKAKANKGN